ncbi:hypothetical protein HK102_007444, partial [Quaeritorhiza haematococci]
PGASAAILPRRQPAPVVSVFGSTGVASQVQQRSTVSHEAVVDDDETTTLVRRAAVSEPGATNTNSKDTSSNNNESASSSSATASSPKHGSPGDTNHDEPLIVTIFPIILTAIGLGCVLQYLLKLLPKYLRPPYTVILFLVGLILAVVTDKIGASRLGLFGASMDATRNLDSTVILFILLPPLLFESGFGMDYFVFKKVAGQSIILAFPGVIITALLIGLFFTYATTYNFDFLTALVLGSILSATDPVAVVAALNNLGAPPRLSLMIEGESLLNDGSAYVLFLIVQELASGVTNDVGQFVARAVQLAIGGPVFGITWGYITFRFLREVYNSPVLEAGILFISTYTCFFIGEEVLHVSSVLATVCFGLYMSWRGKYGLSTRPVQEHHHSVLQQIAFFANTMIFVIAGVVATDNLFIKSSPWNWLMLLWLYVGIHVIRAVTIFILYPILKRMGYGFNMKDMAMLVVAGLRGGVSLVLAIVVKHSNQIQNKEHRDLISFHVSGIVLATVLINGSVTELIYNALKIDIPNTYYGHFVRKSLRYIESETNHLEAKLKRDWFYKNADWDVIRQVVPDLSRCHLRGYKLMFEHEQLREHEQLQERKQNRIQRTGSEEMKTKKEGSSPRFGPQSSVFPPFTATSNKKKDFHLLRQVKVADEHHGAHSAFIVSSTPSIPAQNNSMPQEPERAAERVTTASNTKTSTPVPLTIVENGEEQQKNHTSPSEDGNSSSDDITSRDMDNANLVVPLQRYSNDFKPIVPMQRYHSNDSNDMHLHTTHPPMRHHHHLHPDTIPSFMLDSAGTMTLPRYSTIISEHELPVEDIACQVQSTFLNAVKVNYKQQYAEGYLSQRSLGILEQAADVAKEGAMEFNDAAKKRKESRRERDGVGKGSMRSRWTRRRGTTSSSTTDEEVNIPPSSPPLPPQTPSLSGSSHTPSSSSSDLNSDATKDFDIITTEFARIQESIAPITTNHKIQQYARYPIIGPYVKRKLTSQLISAFEILSGFIHAHEVLIEKFEVNMGLLGSDPSTLSSAGPNSPPTTAVPDLKQTNASVWHATAALRRNVNRATRLARRELVSYARAFPNLMIGVQTVHACRFLLYAKQSMVVELSEQGVLDEKAAGQVAAELERKLQYLSTYKPKRL